MKLERDQPLVKILTKSFSPKTFHYSNYLLIGEHLEQPHQWPLTTGHLPANIQ